MKTRGIGPVFQVGNLTDALKYYKDVLGFKEDFQFGAYAGVSHGDACLHLSANRFHQRPVGGGAAFIFCDEELALSITGICVHHLDALGSYRAPAGNGFVVLALTSIEAASRPGA